jgi:hypothetical protein
MNRLLIPQVEVELADDRNNDEKHDCSQSFHTNTFLHKNIIQIKKKKKNMNINN